MEGRETDPDRLKCQEVQDPVAERGVQAQLDQLSNEVLKNDYVQCGTDVHSIHTYVSLLSKLMRVRCTVVAMVSSIERVG